MNPLSSVTKWLYHIGTVTDSEVKAIANSDAGLVVIDAYNYTADTLRTYTPAELDAMRGGDDKLIVSYISIGEAEDYRDYWDPAWDRNPPNFLSASNPEWPDNYKVKFWDPAWQKIVYDYIDQIIDAGFNGLYLDIIDAYYYWEDVAPGVMDYEKAMAQFVADIRAYVDAKLAASGDTRDFVLIGQNGEELVLQDLYLEAVDGIAKEDLRFYYENGNESGFKKVPDSWYESSLDLLKQAEDAGVEVFVVEYLTQARQSQYASDLSALISELNALDIPFFVAEDRDLDGIYAQPSGIGFEVTPQPDAIVETGQEIFGTKGADVLVGTIGDDTIEGRAGADAIDGGAGVDIVSYASSPGRVVVDLETGTTRFAHARGDTLVNVEGVSGSDHGDALWAASAGSRLSGNGGDDRLEGRAGNDLIHGGAGNDIIRGGFGADTLHGGLGGDTIVGGAGADRIFGNAGADRITGGPGADVIEGGLGWDTFVFGAGFGKDTIRDYDTDHEKLDFSGHAGVTGLTSLVISQVGADTVILDGSGGQVILVGVDASTITASDFVF